MLRQGGEVEYIIHRVEDVTDFVRLKHEDQEQHKMTEALRDRAAVMEAEIVARATQVAEVNAKLRDANIKIAKRAEERDRFFSMSVDLLFIMSKDGSFLRINPAFKALGYTEGDLFGRALADFIHEYDREALRVVMEKLSVSDAPVQFANRFRAKNGTYRWIEWESVPDGAEFVYAAGRDMTDRKRAEDKFRALLESAPDAFILVDRSSQIVLVNAQVESLFGYSRVELLGESIEVVLPLRFRAGYLARLEAYYGTVPTRTVGAAADIEGLRKDGTEFPIAVRLSPIPTPDGLLVAIAIRDVTVARRAEYALHSANEELEHLNRRLGEQNQELVRAGRAKSDFLAMMSHELRTPLNSIIGFSEVIIDEKFGPLNERQGRYLRNVNGSGRHLLRLINDLLDLSKIEAGRLDVARQAFAADAICNDAISTLRPLAEEKQLQLTLHAETTADMFADPLRYKQVVLNLLSNAIKFTPKGGTVRVELALATSGMVRTTVIDSGHGITAEDQSRLFMPFVQLDNAKLAGATGTGLGLALTRQLVTLMGGTIALTSSVGAGARFDVELPPHVATAARDKLPLAQIGRGRVALVVDDDDRTQRVSALAFESIGYAVVLANSAAEALVATRQQLPDVISLAAFLPDAGVAFVHELAHRSRNQRYPRRDGGDLARGGRDRSRRDRAPAQAD